MYYYITEPLTTAAEKKRIEDIKTTLSQLGIAGEFAVASPARTVEEHLELAFKKGFTTIVGIGTDALANKVASTMIRYQYDKAVLGFIPFSNQQALWDMVGTHSIKETCQTLRTRLIIPIDAIELNDERSIITSASMHLDEPVTFRLRFDSVELLGRCTDMTISTQGPVKIWDKTYRQTSQTSGSFFTRLFSGSQSDTSQLSLTSFDRDRWQFETEHPCSILVENQTSTQTPLDVTRRPKALKLIVNRAKITSEKESDSLKES